ncbi:Uncharacterised protein [Mycobacteroides abscessus subsp. abscessus]|nr:Uncharacterised protein [Mycobacteroides abscessus subsp. abscessus]
MAKRAVLPSAETKCLARSANRRSSKVVAGRKKPAAASEPAVARAEFCRAVAIVLMPVSIWMLLSARACTPVASARDPVASWPIPCCSRWMLAARSAGSPRVLNAAFMAVTVC